MTWSYDPRQTQPLDQIRFIIGDTDDDHQLIQDEEVNAQYGLKNNDIRSTCIAICEHLEAKYTQYVETRAGEIVGDYRAVADKFAMLAARIRHKGVLGFWQSDPQNISDDNARVDIVHTNIQRDFDHNLGTGTVTADPANLDLDDD